MNEKSQLPKRDSKYEIILRLIHPDIPPYISFLLIMKLYFTKNLLFYFISYFFRYTGIIIRCANFSISEQQIKLNKTISKMIRNFSSYKMIQLFKMKNKGYLNSCYIIFALCIFRHILYLILYLKLKKQKKEENKDMKIKPFKILIFLDHIVFFIYPYILEHLSFIYYIVYLSDKFYIKKNNDCKQANFILCFFNAIFIIIYNFNGFLHIIAINRPYDDKGSPVQYRYSNIKFWIIFLLQNFCIIESLALFLAGTVLKVFKFVMIIFFFLLFTILYFCSLHNYNYPNSLNKFIEIISGFSFFSLVIEVICCIFNYNILTNTHLIFMTCGKVMVSLLFLFVSDSIAMKFMLNFSKNELFKINKKITNRNVYDVFLFMLKNLRDIYEKEDQTKLQNILSIIYTHKEKCLQTNCKCKLIHISPYGKKYTENYVMYLTQRLSFLIETAFVEIDYTNNYEVALLLSEDYYIFHKNPIMAYSMIQTLLHLQYKKLSMNKILNLYEVSQKYIEFDNELKNKKVKKASTNDEKNTKKNKNNNNNKNQEIIEHNKELELRELFLTLQRINKIQNYYLEYASNFLSILKEKNKFNISTKIEIYKDSITEISSISNIYLTNANIKILLNLLQKEIKNKKQITKLISLLEGTNLPISFIYRSFLFYYYFLGGTLEKEVIPILYSFTNDHNLYSPKINYEIFCILLFRFKKSNIMNKSRYEIIFESTKGIHCSYLSPQLVEILKFQYNDLYNLDLESFLPKNLSIPHTSSIKRRLIFNKHRVYLDKTAFLFGSNGHLYKCIFHCNIIAGLSKNLSFLASLILIEKPKEYYFLLNQNFEAFSLSENFYRDYGISLNFLERCQVSFMDLFGIKSDNIYNDFVIYNQKLKDYKMKLNIIPGEHFTKKTFKNTDRNIKSERGSYSLDDYLNINNSANKNINSDGENIDINNDNKNENEDDEKIKLYQGLINVRKKLEDIYNEVVFTNNNKLFKKCKESKINFISRLYNIFKELIETDIHDKSYLILEQIISKYKDFYNISEIDSDQEKSTLSKKDFFDINLTISLLYDTPYFIVKIREINFNTKFIKFEKSLKADNKNTTLTTELPKEFIYNTETKTNTLSTTITPITKIKVENPNNVIGYNEKNSMDFLNENCMKLVVMSIYFILMLLVVGYLMIYFYQKNTVSISKSLFLSLFYNYYQRDDFFHLYCFYISLYFYYMNLTNIGLIYNNVTLYDFQNLLDQKSINLEDCFHNFYTYYIDFNQKTGYSIDGIFDEFLIEKLSVNWIPGKYKSDYLTEIEFLSYKTKVFKLPKKDDLEEYSSLLYSSKEILLGKYKTLPDNIKVNSTFIIVLYYIVSNGKNYSQLFELLEKKNEDSYLKFTKKSRKIYILLEITCFIISLLFFFLSFYYLNIYNQIIFTKIIKLFINVEIISISKYNEMVKIENYFLIKIIKEFHSLLVDFNLSNINNFNNKLKNELPSGQFTNRNLEEVNNDKEDNKITFSSFSFRKKRKINNSIKETNDNNKEIMDNDKSQKTSVIENLLSRNDSQSKISISSSNLVQIQNPPIGSIGSLNLGIKNKKMLKYNNEFIENNSLFKKGKNVRFKNNNNIDNIKIKNNSENNDSIINNIQITLESFINKLDYLTIYQIKILFIFIGTLFFIYVIYIIFKLIESLGIYTNITHLFNDFQVIMYQYTNIYNFYNNILAAIVLPDFSNTVLLNQMQKMKEEKSLKISDLMNNRISNYKHFNKLYSEIINSFNENDLTKHHLLICDLNNKSQDEKNNSMCYKIISSEYSLFNKGLNIGVDAIFQEMNNIYNDYNSAKTIIKTEQDINKYFTSYKFLKLYLNINFIINKLQDVLYNGFLQEHSFLTNNMNQKALILNLICLVLCVVLIFFVFVFADREVKGLYQMIVESTHRILISFKHIKSKNEKFKQGLF